MHMKPLEVPVMPQVLHGPCGRVRRAAVAGRTNIGLSHPAEEILTETCSSLAVLCREA